jgi:hypothetical protein
MSSFGVNPETAAGERVDKQNHTAPASPRIMRSGADLRKRSLWILLTADRLNGQRRMAPAEASE